MKFLMMVVLGLLPAGAFAHEFTAGALKIEHPWTRATPGGSDMAAGYLSVTNTGKTVDVLEGATVEGVEEVMVHSSSVKDGVASMEHMDEGVVVKPGETVTLKPGGIHLMWMGLQKPLKAGEMVSGSLVFKAAGTVKVGFKVEAAGAQEAAHQH